MKKPDIFLMVFIFIKGAIDNKEYLSMVATDGHRLAKIDYFSKENLTRNTRSYYS